jgi:hypothetical protein
MAKRTSRTNGSSATELIAAAPELMAISAASGIAGLQAAAAAPLSAPTAVIAAAAAAPPVAESAIEDELARGGPAFGSLVREVCLAIAASQAALDENLVKTAKALSETSIKVVSVFEQRLDDEGEITEGKAILQDLPLVNFITPIGYQFSEATIVSDMQVSEFNSANGFNVQAKSQSFSAGLNAGFSRRSGFSISGSAAFANSSSEVAGSNTFGQDSAAGQVHVEVKLRPRPEFSVGKPTIVQAGAPVIRLLPGAATDIATGRSLQIAVDVRKADGTPNGGKTIGVTAEPASLIVTSTNNSLTTDATTGKLTLVLERSGDPTNTVKGTLTIFLGLVTKSIAVEF